MGAFVGWLTNFVAVVMLFRPRNPVNILGYKFQGLIPKKQKFLAEELGTLAEEELLSGGHLQGRLLGNGNVDNIVGLIENKIDDYLLNTFPDKYPITSVFFGVKRKAQIKADLLEEVHVAVPELIADYAENLDKEIQIKEIVRQKVEALDPMMLEGLLHTTLRGDLRLIGWMCAGVGFVIGLIQSLILFLL